MNWFKLSPILFLLSYSVAAKPVFKINNLHAIEKQYFKYHKEFSKKMCRPGTEEKFWKMYRAFRGEGHFVPVLPDDSLDLRVVKKFIPELKRKRKWIKTLYGEVKRIDFRKLHLQIKNLKQQINTLQKTKEEIDKKIKGHEQALQEAKFKMLNLKESFYEFLDEVSFLKPYQFPNDHFLLRKEYDIFKASKVDSDKTKANEVYFYRQIVQDGALNPNNKGSDRVLRANIDTIYLSLTNSEGFLTETQRFDLMDVLKGIEKQLNRGRDKIRKRLAHWEKRVLKRIEFYNNLKNLNSNKNSIDTFLAGQKEARSTLHKYVLEQEAKSYEFWKEKPKLYRAIFSLETILFNEVGLFDGKEALERKDVIKVAINRSVMDEYSTIEKKEFLYPYLLKHSTDEEIQSLKWLNVLFKQGEFSFTYFFIPGNVKIYCPDMSRTGKSLRRKNVRLSLKQLKRKMPHFNGVRYFSRASMLGKVDMSLLWEGFKPIPQRVGGKKTNDRILRTSFKSRSYTYFYSFQDIKGDEYEVLEIKGRTYARSKRNGGFYKYRNPHYFTYFSQ